MSIYEVSALGIPGNQIVFNDPTVNPYYRVMTRLPKRFDVRQQDIPIPFESGVSDFITLLGGVVYTIAGIMYPADDSSYDAGRQALAAISSLDLQQLSQGGEEDGYVPYSWGDSLNSTHSKQIFMKVLYVHMQEDTRQGLQQPFQLVCKIKDPIIYGSTLKTASTAQANPSSTTGTFVLPKTLPAPIGITMYTVSANANNIGNIPTYPTSVTIHGPVVNPKVTNSATGEYIQVNATLSSGSDVLLIEYGKDTFSITKNGVNYSQYLTDDSALFKIVPGVNTITLDGALSTGAYCEVSYYDSWPLA